MGAEKGHRWYKREWGGGGVKSFSVKGRNGFTSNHGKATKGRDGVGYGGRKVRPLEGGRTTS